jgi:thymidylate synthase ThyX
LKEDKYYLPEDWDGININLDWDNAKDEHGFHLGVPFKCAEIKDWNDMLGWYTRLGNFLYHSAVKDLEPVLGRKRAKESARFFKTYNSQIQADVSFNMRSFANFQKLRNSEHSQLEIREIADKMLDLVINIEGGPFKHTLEAWEKK